MKKFIRTTGLSIGVFVIAIGAAFATNAMKDNGTLLADKEGYIQQNSKYSCLKKQVMCTTTPTGEFCTWEELPGQNHRLYDLTKDENNLTICSVPLYKID